MARVEGTDFSLSSTYVVLLVCQAHPAFMENCTRTLLLLSKIALLVPLFY